MNSVPFIVLVEDNPPDVLLVRIALEQVGLECQLQVFSDGDEAFRYLAGREDDLPSPRPDLLLIDLNLPKRSGRELLQGLLEESTAALPSFIVISSSDSPEDKEAAAQFGAVGFFRKPADLDEFMKLGDVVLEALETGHRKGSNRLTSA